MKKQNFTLSRRIAAYVLLLACTVLCLIMILSSNSLADGLTYFFELMAVGMAFMYFILGCKKDSAKYYRMTFLFFASTYVVDFLILSAFPVKYELSSLLYFSITANIVLYGNDLILAISKDLGKKTAITLNCVSILLYILLMIMAFDGVLVHTLSLIHYILLSVICLIMTFEKYADKEKRGSK